MKKFHMVLIVSTVLSAVGLQARIGGPRKTTVINQSQQPVTIYFKSTHCLTPAKSVGPVCTMHRDVVPGGSVSYIWKIGHDRRVIVKDMQGNFYISRGALDQNYSWDGAGVMNAKVWRPLGAR